MSSLSATERCQTSATVEIEEPLVQRQTKTQVLHLVILWERGFLLRCLVGCHVGSFEIATIHLEHEFTVIICRVLLSVHVTSRNFDQL